MWGGNVGRKRGAKLKDRHNAEPESPGREPGGDAVHSVESRQKDRHNARPDRISVP